MSEATSTDKEPWITVFDDEITEWGEGTFDHALGVTLKGYLLSDGDSAAADTARQIHIFYEQEHLHSDPLMKYEDDQGMGAFLSGFYEIVFTLARVIPYNNSNQEKLVWLLLELRKLPPRQFKIWKEDCLVWTREPVFVVLMDDNWNGNYPSDAKERKDGDGKYSFQQLCNQWINFSSFLARCIEAGLNDGYKDRCKYPSIDVPKALEQDMQPGPKRDCEVMVAAQYILLSGRTLVDDCFKKPVKVFGPDRWRRWAEKLGEISRQESGNTRLGSVADEARKYMVSLYPEVF